MTSRFSSESISVPACVLTVATFDQRVNVRRSSNGKSNNVDSICVVNSIETRSTQSNTSSRGSSCRMRIARSRIVEDIFARFGGATMGATILRCSSCRGGSIAIKLSFRYCSGTSFKVTPPKAASEE
jgi:hypothetical protein